jgi:hypothetical protein
MIGCVFSPDEEERVVRIGYRLHMTRRAFCRCDRETCDACTKQFLFDCLTRVVRHHNKPERGTNGGPVLEQLN